MLHMHAQKCRVLAKECCAADMEDDNAIDTFIGDDKCDDLYPPQPRDDPYVTFG